MNIHHIGYLVKDIEKAKEAFKKLGFKITQAVSEDLDRKASICFINNGAYCVELISLWKESDLYPLLKKYKKTAYHICYEVGCLELAIKKMQKEGFTLVRVPEKAVSIGGGNARVAFLMDIDIGMIELVELGKGAYGESIWT